MNVCLLFQPLVLDSIQIPYKQKGKMFFHLLVLSLDLVHLTRYSDAHEKTSSCQIYVCAFGDVLLKDSIFSLFSYKLTDTSYF